MHKSLTLLTVFLLAVATTWSQFEPGCTNINAVNYDANATIEDGTCCYESWVTIEVSDPMSEVYVYSNLVSFYLDPFGSGGNGFCAPDGCYGVYFTGGSEGSGVNVYLNGELLVVGTYDFNYPEGFFEFGINSIVGCSDPGACNYVVGANCDFGLCDYSCYGCTDSNSPNYNANATIDDGSCCDSANWITSIFPEYEGFSAYGSIWGTNGQFYMNVFPGSSFCLPEGCYSIQVFIDDEVSSVAIELVNAEGDVLYSGFSEGNELLDNFDYNAVAGCSDYYACNYDPNATCYDYLLCTYDCFGCTNPEADNYNPEATIDNGTCCSNTLTIVASADFQWNVWSYYSNGAYGTYPEQNSFCVDDGCFYFDIYSFQEETFDWQLVDDEGNTIYSGTVIGFYGGQYIELNALVGCSDPNSCNFNPEATCNDLNSCDYSCQGCTDPNAPNYSADATIDNGSCCYLNWFTLECSEPGYWYVYSNNGSGGGSGNYPESNGFCVDDGCFSLTFYPNDFANTDATISVYDGEGNQIATGEYDTYVGGVFVLVENESISGCMDMYACNFNVEATCYDYSSCDYSCYGCTDPSAPNYDADATIDNGFCCYNDWYTVELSSPGYWYVYSINNGTYQSGYYPDQNGFCVDQECLQFGVWSYDVETGTYTIFDENGDTFSEGNYDYFGFGSLISGGDEVQGCADFSACNYNPDATCLDYSLCDYSCYGCTDPAAPNFDESATIDNGSCCYSNWYTISVSGDAYWYVYGNNSYGSGIYPYNNGFCAADECFHVGIYSLINELTSVTVFDSQGNIVATATFDGGYYNSVSVSSNGEIAGCTDPNSCNYNPEATCDDLSCNIYCGGCTDSSALNYNPNAWYEDGSCIYFIEPPLMGMIIMPDELNNQYYVMVNMMETGNGAPYIVSDDYGSDMMMIEVEGQYLSGPYPCDEDVILQLESMSMGMQEYFVSSPLSGPCSETVSVDEELNVSSLQLFPNPANQLFSVTGVSGYTCDVVVYDMNGRQVMNQQMNVSAGRIDVNCDEFTSGLYQVRISDLSGDSILRVIVE